MIDSTRTSSARHFSEAKAARASASTVELAAPRRSVHRQAAEQRHGAAPEEAVEPRVRLAAGGAAVSRVEPLAVAVAPLREQVPRRRGAGGAEREVLGADRIMARSCRGGARGTLPR